MANHLLAQKLAVTNDVPLTNMDQVPERLDKTFILLFFVVNHQNLMGIKMHFYMLS